MRLINRNCTLLIRADEEVDDFSSQQPDYTELETVCELQQRSREEPAAEGELSRTDWDVFLLPGFMVHAGDRMLVDGELYEFIGDAWEARSPVRGQLGHIEATARRSGADPPEGS